MSGMGEAPQGPNMGVIKSMLDAKDGSDPEGDQANSKALLENFVRISTMKCGHEVSSVIEGAGHNSKVMEGLLQSMSSVLPQSVAAVGGLDSINKAFEEYFGGQNAQNEEMMPDMDGAGDLDMASSQMAEHYGDVDFSVEDVSPADLGGLSSGMHSPSPARGMDENMHSL